MNTAAIVANEKREFSWTCANARFGACSACLILRWGYRSFRKLTANLDKSGGIERILDYIFYQGVAINGFDGVSHYLRAELLTNLCSQYAASTAPGCSANFRTTRTIGAASAAKNPFQAAAAKKPKAAKAAKAPAGPSAADLAKQRKAALDRIRSGVRNGSPAYGPRSQSDAILNYLLGNGG